MKENQFYTCGYCFNEFIPKRRRVQKFCSHSCRSKAHHSKKTKTKMATLPSLNLNAVPKPDTIKKPERISAVGIGNAALGTLAVDTAKAIFTSEDNKSATKGDLKRLAVEINARYHRVKNMSPRSDGALPYYDFDTRNVVYLLHTPLLQ